MGKTETPPDEVIDCIVYCSQCPILNSFSEEILDPIESKESRTDTEEERVEEAMETQGRRGRPAKSQTNKQWTRKFTNKQTVDEAKNSNLLEEIELKGNKN